MIEYAIQYNLPTGGHNYVAYWRKRTALTRWFNYGEWHYIGGAETLQGAMVHIKADRSARKATRKMAVKLVKKIKV